MTHGMIVFEDSRWRDLRPLSDLTPVPALVFGASSLAERLALAANLPLGSIAARPDALTVCRTLPRTQPESIDASGIVLIVNGAALPGDWLRDLAAGESPELVRSGGRVVGARLPADAARAFVAPGGSVDPRLRLSTREVEARFIEHPWQLVEWNAEAIAADLAPLGPGTRGEVAECATVLGDSGVTIEAGARVDPCAVLDARLGPILIRRGAVVASHTLIVGPCLVGEGTQLLGGSISRSTIGRECRIAGEVEESLWQGFANKRHHGFVGHSVLGEWVNLGALTTTSDLKNNYGNVRVWVDGRERDSGNAKVGSFVGAHVKTGIGTLLPTGASLGVGANVFGGGRFTPKAVPSFAWWDGERSVEHRLGDFLETAAIVLPRRGEALSVDDRAAWTRWFEATRGERSRS